MGAAIPEYSGLTVVIIDGDSQVASWPQALGVPRAGEVLDIWIPGTEYDEPYQYRVIDVRWVFERPHDSWDVCNQVDVAVQVERIIE